MSAIKQNKIFCGGGKKMKGIPGKATRGLPKGARLTCADNTGARIVEIVSVAKIGSVARRYPAAGIGDMITVSVKKGRPELRRQLLNAVVVRTRRPYKRPDGTMVQFEDNAAVIVTPDGDPKGSAIKGPIARESAERWPRVASTASIIV
jgi:large subunit ribosomal protein L14